MNLALKAALYKRLKELARIRDIAEAGWERTGDSAHAVRRSEVHAAVAKELGIAVSPALSARVTAIMAAAGWTPIRTHNTPLFMGVKRREHTDEEARALARKLREER